MASELPFGTANRGCDSDDQSNCTSDGSCLELAHTPLPQGDDPDNMCQLRVRIPGISCTPAY